MSKPTEMIITEPTTKKITRGNGTLGPFALPESRRLERVKRLLWLWMAIMISVVYCFCSRAGNALLLTYVELSESCLIFFEGKFFGTRLSS